MSTDWSPSQYLQFADQRTRPAVDLLRHVPSISVDYAVDIGCGPGNSTELLAARFPSARIEGIDSSEEMVRAARLHCPGAAFLVTRIEDWAPVDQPDLIFANAVLQWLPEHACLLQRLVGYLREGGTLAIQMPDNLDEPSHVAMREAAEDPRWAASLVDAGAERWGIGTPQSYYEILRTHCRGVEVWRTIYHHPLDGIDGVIDWFRSTGLRPYLSRLPSELVVAYLEKYRERLLRHYPVHADGTVLLPFPRLFVIASV